MKPIVVVCLFQFAGMNMVAQTPVQGEYIFSRQEMVAGFKFSAGGKFEFFYSYGAVDRMAKGIFLVEGSKLKLTSDKEAGKDFTVKTQSKTGKGYTLRFEDANKYLLSNIQCTFFIGKEKHEEFTDDRGEIHVDFPHCDKIYVQHHLFPDIATLVKDEQNKNNTFTLTLNSSLVQVSFKGIDFTIEDAATISCLSNYFMMLEDKIIRFKKQ